MTTQEEKELHLFNIWWNINYPKEITDFDTMDEDYKNTAEQAWIARSRLNKQFPTKTLDSYERSL